MHNLNGKIDHLQRSQPAKYQIKIQGRLNETWSDWMDNLETNVVRQDEGTTITILTGIVKDQAGRHRLLNRIRDLCVPLIAVQFINPNDFAKE